MTSVLTIPMGWGTTWVLQAESRMQFYFRAGDPTPRAALLEGMLSLFWLCSSQTTNS